MGAQRRPRRDPQSDASAAVACAAHEQPNSLRQH